MKFGYLLMMIMIASCGQGHVDMETPKIIITSPSTTQALKVDQPVSVKATITDNEVLSKLEWHIINGQNGTRLEHTEELVGQSYELHRTITPEQAGQYVVYIEAKDKWGNMGAEHYVFYIQ